MASWADSSERFVEIPGIVEIRWVSDDPDYYVPPIDLFDEQVNGLPDFYGKKDKTTTEQAFFTCNVCECDLKSVVTLRAHCKGTQHIRKALQKKKEWRKVNVKKEPKLEMKTETFRTLFDWLDQGTSEAVVGLEHVTEYLSGRERDLPYYHCNLEHCKDEQGDAESMKNHLLTARHKQAWLEKKTGSFLKHQTEISQRIAEFTKDFKRDFRDMKVLEDRDLWAKAKQGRIREERTEMFRTKKERVEENESRSQRKSQEGELREYEEESGNAGRRQDFGRERRFEFKKERYGDVERERGYDHDRDDRERYRSDGRRGYENSSTGGYRSDRDEREDDCYERTRHGDGVRDRSPVRRERSVRGDYREVKTERREAEEPRYQSEMVDRRRSPRVEENRGDEVEELARSGNFSNWSTARVKVDPNSDPNLPSTSSKMVVSTSSKQKSVSEEVDRLHRKVANKVMKSLNKYYPGAEEFDPYQHKIGSPEEYSRLAKQFSHQLRKKIKESYEAYNTTLDGIELTGDHEQSIRTEVDSYFEGIPRIR